MTEIKSVVVPGGASTPKVRKGQPAPFSRPRIDLDAGRIKRDWQRIAVCNVAEGDIVPDVGRVETIVSAFSVDADEPYTITLFGAGGVTKTFPGTAEILVFAPEAAR